MTSLLDRVRTKTSRKQPLRRCFNPLTSIIPTPPNKLVGRRNPLRSPPSAERTNLLTPCDYDESCKADATTDSDDHKDRPKLVYFRSGFNGFRGRPRKFRCVPSLSCDFSNREGTREDTARREKADDFVELSCSVSHEEAEGWTNIGNASLNSLRKHHCNGSSELPDTGSCLRAVGNVRYLGNTILKAPPPRAFEDIAGAYKHNSEDEVTRSAKRRRHFIVEPIPYRSPALPDGSMVRDSAPPPFAKKPCNNVTGIELTKHVLVQDAQFDKLDESWVLLDALAVASPSTISHVESAACKKFSTKQGDKRDEADAEEWFDVKEHPEEDIRGNWVDVDQFMKNDIRNLWVDTDEGQDIVTHMVLDESTLKCSPGIGELFMFAFAMLKKSGI